MNQVIVDKFIKALKHLNVTPTDKVVVAISGGADSMSLAHLFLAANQPIALAHCNFNLRAEESDKDELFVRHFAREQGVPIFVASFETEQIAKQRGISIEMAARDLRYAWFEELRIKENYNYIATGHHQNDSVETFFLNLNRGTGIKGLMGISELNREIIRPLLDFSREEIETYLFANKLEFCTDKSNFENHYLRNKFRNRVIPQLQEINPQFSQKLLETMGHLKQVYESFRIRLEQVSNQIIIDDGERTIISQSLVTQLPDKEIILFEILSTYGFNKSQITDILCFNTTKNGQQFFSNSHRLIKDRHNYIILKKVALEKETFYFNHAQENPNTPIELSFSELDAKEFAITRETTVANLDADLIEFPLTLRHWQQGDEFKPLGMTGFKKLSDFFIDLKLSHDQKENCWLLLSGDDIVWIVNFRIDDRYKITSKTRRVLRIELSKAGKTK